MSAQNYKICPLEGCLAKYNIHGSYKRHLLQKHQKPKRFLAEHPFDGQPFWVAPTELIPTLTQQALDSIQCACPVPGCSKEFKYLSTRLLHLTNTHKYSKTKAEALIARLDNDRLEGPQQDGDDQGEKEVEGEGVGNAAAKGQTPTKQELDCADCACPVAGCGAEFKHLSTHLTHLKMTHKMSGKKAADAIKQLPPPRYTPRETCLAMAKPMLQPAVPEVSKPGKQRGLGSQADYLRARLTANVYRELTAKEVVAFVAEQRAKDLVFAQAWAKFVAEKDGSEEKAKESARQSIRSYVRSHHHLTPPKPEPPPPPKVYRQTLTENKSSFFRQHFCPEGQPPKQFSQRELCNSADPEVQRNFGSVVETLLARAKGERKNMTQEETQAAAYRAIYQNLRSFVARHAQPDQHQAPVEAQVEAPPCPAPRPKTPVLQGTAAASTWIFNPDPAIPNLAQPNLGFTINIGFTPGGTASAQVLQSLPQPRGPGTVTLGFGQHKVYLCQKLLSKPGPLTILEVRHLVADLKNSDQDFAAKWAHFVREKGNDEEKAHKTVKNCSEAKGRAATTSLEVPARTTAKHGMLTDAQAYFFRTFYALDGKMPQGFNVQCCLSNGQRNLEFRQHFEGVMARVAAKRKEQGKALNTDMEVKKAAADTIRMNLTSWVRHCEKNRGQKK